MIGKDLDAEDAEVDDEQGKGHGHPQDAGAVKQRLNDTCQKGRNSEQDERDKVLLRDLSSLVEKKKEGINQVAVSARRHQQKPGSPVIAAGSVNVEGKVGKQADKREGKIDDYRDAHGCDESAGKRHILAEHHFDKQNPQRSGHRVKAVVKEGHPLHDHLRSSRAVDVQVEIKLRDEKDRIDEDHGSKDDIDSLPFAPLFSVVEIDQSEKSQTDYARLKIIHQHRPLSPFSKK